MGSITYKLQSPERLTEPPMPSFLLRKLESILPGRRAAGRAAARAPSGPGSPSSCRRLHADAPHGPGDALSSRMGTLEHFHLPQVLTQHAQSGLEAVCAPSPTRQEAARTPQRLGTLRRSPPLWTTEVVTQPSCFSDYINLLVMGEPSPQIWLLDPKLQEAKREGSGLLELREMPRRGARAFLVALVLVRGFQ